LAGLDYEIHIDMIADKPATMNETDMDDRTEIFLDAGKYENATFYVEAIVENDEGTSRTLTFNNMGSNNTLSFNHVWAIRKRHASATVPNNNKLKYLTDSGTSTDVKIWTARIVIIQTSSRKTEMQLNLGCDKGVTATSYANATNLGNICRKFYYNDNDAFDYDGERFVMFEAILKSSSGSGTAYCALKEADGTTVPTNGEVSTSSTSFTRVRNSGGITLTDNEEYEIDVKSSSGSYTASIINAKLIFQFRSDSTTHTNTTGTSEQSVYSIFWSAQTFTTGGSTFDIEAVDLHIKKTGSPGTLTVGIRATSGGSPTGSDLVTGYINDSEVSTSFGWIRCEFDPYTLTGNTKYAIVVRATSGYIGNTYSWYYDNGGDPFSGGDRYTSILSGLFWSLQSNDDHQFKVYQSEDVTEMEIHLRIGYEWTGYDPDVGCRTEWHRDNYTNTPTQRIYFESTGDEDSPNGDSIRVWDMGTADIDPSGEQITGSGLIYGQSTTVRKRMASNLYNALTDNYRYCIDILVNDADCGVGWLIIQVGGGGQLIEREFAENPVVTASIADSIDYEKVINESPTITDILYIYEVLPSYVYDDLFKSISKPFSDSPSPSDAVFYIWGRLLSESVTPTDGVELGHDYEILLTSFPGASDYRTMGVELFKSVNISPVDTLTTVHEMKAFLNESPNVNDTVVYLLGKFMSESPGTTDTWYGGFYKYFTETVNPTDAISFLITMLLSISPTPTDTLTTAMDYVRSLSETPVTTDTDSYLVGLLKSESLTPTDNVTTTLQIFKALNESLTPTDALSLLVGILKTESPDVTDNLADVWAVYRALNESVNPASTLSVVIGKLLSESENPTVAVTFDLARSFNETINPTDALSLIIGLLKSETPVTSDTLTVAWELYLALNESPSPTDALSMIVGKILSESENPTDNLTFVWDITRTLNETINPSETLSMLVGKFMTEDETPVDSFSYELLMGLLLQESINPTDTIVNAFHKHITQSANPAEYIRFVIAKVLAESQTPTDFVKFPADFTKDLSENITPTSALSFLVEIFKNETINPTDTPVLTWEIYRTLSETPSPTDTLTELIGKILSISPNVTDTFVIAFLKALSESPGTTDNISQAIIMSMGENITPTDALSFLLTKLFSESPSVVDSIVFGTVIKRLLSESPIVTGALQQFDMGIFKDETVNPIDTESLVWEIYTTLSETPVTTDNLIDAIGIFYNESPGTTDAIVNDVMKALGETPVPTDTISVYSEFFKLLSESQTPTADLLKMYQIFLNESPTVSLWYEIADIYLLVRDSIDLYHDIPEELFKTLYETPSCNDVLTHLIAVSKSETPSPTDIVNFMFQMSRTELETVQDAILRSADYIRSLNETPSVQSELYLLLELLKAEAPTTTDTLLPFNIAKAMSELLNPVDAFTRVWAIERLLSENPNTTAVYQQVWDLYRLFNEAPTTDDHLLIQRVLSYMSDSLWFNIGKFIDEETPSVIDAVTPAMDYIRALADNPVTTDAILSLDVGKLISENPSVNDVITRAVAMVREQSVSTTDTYLQEWAISYILQETPSTNDTLSFTWEIYRTLSETPSVVDGIAWQVGLLLDLFETVTPTDTVILGLQFYKELAESPIVSDALSKALQRLLSESVTPTDNYQLMLLKYVSETPGVTDEIKRIAGKYITQNAVSTDAITFALARIISENPSTTDTLLKNTLRTLSESPGITDTLLHLDIMKLLEESETPTETIVFDFMKVLNAYPAVQDAFRMQVSLYIAELETVTDNVTGLIALFRSFTEDPTIQDTIRKGLYRTFEQDLTPTVEITRTWNAYRSFLETPIVSDNIVKTFQKIISESQVPVDEVKTVWGAFLDLSETPGITDLLSFYIQKFMTDESITPVDQRIFRFIREITEDPTVLDSYRMGMQIVMEETPAVTDVFSWEWLKRVLELLLSESVATTESVRKGLQRLFTEAPSVIDSVIRGFLVNLILTEVQTVSDSIVKTIGKYIPQSVGITTLLDVLIQRIYIFGEDLVSDLVFGTGAVGDWIYGVPAVGDMINYIKRVIDIITGSEEFNG
jgi:hypothetical protein